MAATNIVEQVRKLVALQKLDAQIYDLKKALKEKPAVLAELNGKFEEKKAGLKAAEEKHKAMLLDRKSLEGDLKSKEEAMAKANAQLSQLKTNREYTAKVSEIENIKADKSIIEERILAAYDKADEAKAEIDKEKGLLVSEEQEYLKQRKTIEDSIKEVDGKIKVLDSQRAQIIPGVEKHTLARYEKILANKEGLAIVPVAGVSCGGCFMNVPAQVVNEIKMHEQLVLCEMCARILYLEEDIS